MKLNKTTEATKETEKVTFEVEVLRAHAFDSQTIAFDANVNGVTIYGMIYREYVTKEGKDGYLISFPSRQAKDGKYYDNCWFPISKELKENIKLQIEKLV